MQSKLNHTFLMHNLINFLIKNSYWFLFIFLELIAGFFFFSKNSYQRSVFLNSSNYVSGMMYSTTAGIKHYFGLREENQHLLLENGKLQERINKLENYIFNIQKDSIIPEVYLDFLYNNKNEYIPAQVINNSVSRPKNFITLNKGRKNDVEVGMGVISTKGIVGEIVAVSDYFSVVRSLLNTENSGGYSGKLLSSNSFNTLYWDGTDSRFVTLDKIPTYEKIVIGDTVVTSGHSNVFPANMMIGVVKYLEIKENSNDYTLTVELSNDFRSLNEVLIIKRDYLKEQNALEQSVYGKK